MERIAMSHLREWRDGKRRKPLVVRGARQVGKSYLVREFGGEVFENLVEINFELDRSAADLFRAMDPRKVVPLLELHCGADIRPGSTLLFLDEVQAAPQVFSALRYFQELMPALHVIAAGSLLDFALSAAGFSVPVGRIEYLHLGPMTFEEHLLAGGHRKLVAHLRQYDIGDVIPPPIHEDLLGLLRTYLVVGGMPEAQEVWHTTGSVRAVEAVKQSVLATYDDDFGKYGANVAPDMLRKLFGVLPAMVGRKLTYASVDRTVRSDVVSRGFDLLCKARVVQKVRHTDAVGLPFGATADERKFKPLFLDVGLMATSCGLSLLDIERAGDVVQVNSGAVCEQFVGQHLLGSVAPNVKPEVFYWAREKRNSSAEVDYLLSSGGTVFPVEVKAGRTGKLRSMQIFLRERGLNFGVRLNSDLPSLTPARAVLADKSEISYRLLSLPLYLVGEVPRLAAQVLGRSHAERT